MSYDGLTKSGSGLAGQCFSETGSKLGLGTDDLSYSMRRFFWMSVVISGVAIVAAGIERWYSFDPSGSHQTHWQEVRPLSVDRGFVPAVQPQQTSPETSDEEALLSRLSSKVPDEPAFVDREILDLMQKVAKVGKLDAARLLIKCFAFSLDPGNHDDDSSDNMMIPAIKLLGDNFSSTAARLLYEQGAPTDKVWFRNRIALAARTILPPAEVESLQKRALSDVLLKPHAFAFGESLAAEHLDVKLNAPREKRMADLDKSIDEAKRRNKGKQPR